MLYERWRTIAGERRDELALRDFVSGRDWTFDELFAAGEARTSASAATVYPRGHAPEFLFDLLAAWRDHQIVCPLEPNQVEPGPLARQPARGLTQQIVHLKSTSATGGAPRGVAFTAEQLMADAENIVATMGLRPDWPNLGVISLAHSYGFSNLVLPLLLHGIPLILAPAPLPEIIRRAAATASFLTVPAVPAMWRAWHAAGAIPHNVRLAISAGSPLPVTLEQDIFQSCGIKIHNFLGSTECGGIAYDGAERQRGDDAYVGTPMQNVHLSLNADGCLVVRSRAVGESYWPDKSDSLVRGIFQTSDLAELIDGAVFLRGRLGDQVNIAGRKVSPDAIERVLLTHPHVRECLVFGVPSRAAERAEMIVAVVAADVTELELKNFLLQTMPAWQIPREWRFVDLLSTNVRGKISRAEWRKRFMAESDAKI
jgi:long-chain acyl-CoA synthetase